MYALKRTIRCDVQSTCMSQWKIFAKKCPIFKLLYDVVKLDKWLTLSIFVMFFIQAFIRDYISHKPSHFLLQPLATAADS